MLPRLSHPFLTLLVHVFDNHTHTHTQVLDGQYYERNGEPKCALHAIVPDSATECKVCARAVDDGDAVWYVVNI